MPKGGYRPGAGRKLGSKNRSTAEMRAQARMHTDEAILTISKIMKRSRKDITRITAAQMLLDRGHGKPSQEVDATVKHEGRVQFTWLPPQPPRKPNAQS